jgi:hypothetical protein
MFCLLFCLTFSLSAQPGSQRPGTEREGKAAFERIKTARQQFLTEKLELTTKEAEAFFPLFWRYDEQMRTIMREDDPGRRDRRKTDNSPVSEAEARKMLEDQLARMESMTALKRESTDAYLRVIPAAKLIQLEEANREFRRELLDRLRNRREK